MLFTKKIFVVYKVRKVVSIENYRNLSHLADGNMMYSNIFIEICRAPSDVGFYFINSAKDELLFCAIITHEITLDREIKTKFNYSPAPLLTSSFVIEFNVSRVILVESRNSDEN